MAAGSIRLRIISLLSGLTGVGIIVFWVTFPLGNPQESFLARVFPAWYPWERSFIVADGWVALSSLVAAVGLFRRRRWGLHWAGMAGSATLFLALMDILFFLQNGLYRHAHPEVWTEMLIHAWLLGWGAFLVAETSRSAGKGGEV